MFERLLDDVVYLWSGFSIAWLLMDNIAWLHSNKNKTGALNEKINNRRKT